MLALEALMASTGPEGVGYELKAVMESILRDWASEDFEGAWAAALDQSHPGLKRFMLSTLLDTQFANDPEKTFSLYLEQAAKDPAFPWNVPLKTMGLRAGEGADAYIEAFSKLPWGNFNVGTTMKFSVDFDFRKVADAVSTLGKASPDQITPVFASNFFETWAARNAEEAQAWWKQNGSVMLDNWGGILTGVEKSMGPQAAAEWAAHELQSNPEKRKEMLEGIIPSHEGSSHRINLIADSMPDVASRDAFLSDFFATTRHSDPLDRFSFVISGMSSPETRLDALRNFRETAGYIIDTNVPDTQLQEWGISRDQLNETLRPKKKAQ